MLYVDTGMMGSLYQPLFRGVLSCDRSYADFRLESKVQGM